MFRPVRMCKIEVIGLRREMKKTIQALHEYGGAEIKEIRAKGIERDSELPEYSSLAGMSIRLEAITKQLGINTEKTRKDRTTLSKREIDWLEKFLAASKTEISDIENRLKEIDEERKRLSFFRKFDLDFSDLDTPEIEVVAGLLESEKLASARLELNRAVSYFEILQKELTKNQQVVLVAVKQGNGEKARSILEKVGLKQLQLPKTKGQVDKALKSLDSEEKSLLQKKALKQKEIEKTAKDLGGKIAATLEELEIEKDRAGVTRNFGKTAESFAFEAFLPEKKFGQVKQLLERNMGNRVHIEKIGFEELEKRHEHPPVLLDNPKNIGQFEYLISFMSLPKSFELDPTIIFTIFFPLFYGMMLGDFGYGLISILIAFLLLKKFKNVEILRNVAKLWMAVAISAMLFGVVFDEYFGLTHKEVFEIFGMNVELYKGIERLHETSLLLAISVLTGVFAVSMGFLFGAVNGLIEKNTKHAIAKIAWFFAVVSGTVAISGFMFKMFSADISTGAAAILGVSILAIIKTEGAVGIIELPSTTANILSFSRIMAVGLASVVVALIINEFLKPKLEDGLMLIVIVPLFFILHALNTFIGMFEGLIQGGRLNFVELFSKFFEGGGKEFLPFSVENTMKKSKGGM